MLKVEAVTCVCLRLISIRWP